MKLKKLFFLAATLDLAALPSLASETETLCSGESAEVKLDLATGTVRTPAATETLTYSTEWDGGSAVTLAANGTTLTSGLTGSGTYDWTPSGSGLFTLTHLETNGTPAVLSALFNVPVKVARNTATGTEYTSVQTAFNEATAGQTIALITDVAENVSIYSVKTNTLDLAGHVLKGAAAGTAPVITIDSADAAVTIRDTSASHTGAITTGGAVYEGNGAGIRVANGLLSLYDVTITNCVASGNGGAIYGGTNTQILVQDCLLKANGAGGSGGGIYMVGGTGPEGNPPPETTDKLVLISTLITGNEAGTAGAGVYFKRTAMGALSCFVAGTLVAMADGTTKAIEEVRDGDVVKTFDHEGGTNSSARVFFWLKEAVTTRAFTLAFAGGYSVNCVLTHDFLMKDGEDSCRYVCLGRANAADYVGKLFYGLDGQWHELLSVTDGEEVSEIYELYTAQHFNSYANGMLTVPADVAANLNFYKLDANLKADADQLAADVAKYGYYTYEEAAARGVSRAYYDDAGVKYVNVIVGKGLATWEELENTYASAQGLTSTVSTPTSNVPRLTSLMPKLAAANGEAKIDDFDASVLTLGADVIVTNNTLTGGSANNIYLEDNISEYGVSSKSLVAFADSHSGICAGVTFALGTGQFTTNVNVSASDAALFTSDNPAYVVKFASDHLELVDAVTFTPTAVDYATAEVYVDDIPALKSGDTYQIPSNATATVVYTAESGYVFSDGSTTATKTITTSTNPATAETPAAPFIPVAKIVETGVHCAMVQTAFDAAADGQTVQLLANATENVTLEAADKTNTLDLAGYVLCGVKGEGTNSVIRVSAGGLTISDSNPASVHYYKVDTNGVWVWQADFSGTENYTFSIADGLKENGEATDLIPTANDVIAVKGGAITGGTGTPEGTTTYGGGVCVLENGALTVNGGTIVGNRIAGNYVAGGGIYIHGKDGGQYTLTNCALVGNVGGGLYCDYGAYALTSCHASYNRAGLGGGVYLRENGTAVIKGVKIIGNDATSSVGGSGEALRGGGVYALGALVLSDCVVRGNSASAGGGLDIWKTAAITNCIVANNTAAGSAGGIAVLNAGSITVKGGEISGNTTIGDGGGMYVSSAELGGSATIGCKATLIDVVLSGNSAANGGAVCQADTSELLMLGCMVTNNTATTSGGGICKLGDDYDGTVAGKCVLIDTEITGNTSGENGGGVYFRNATCLAAGTMVSMADGTTKAIEDVKEGDFVRTFDHEGGTNSTAQVYLAYKGETKETPFTLLFDNGRTLSIVGRHDLLLKDTRKYVTITGANVGQYVGAKFYGADGAWHTLVSATMGAEAVAYYSIYTTPDRNVFANGLLTVADDADFLLNLYELDENLKADADQLAADIAQYGLYTYEEAQEMFPGVSRALYDIMNGRYYKIVVGKQLVSSAYLQKTFATCFSPKSATSVPTSNVPRLTSSHLVANAAPLLAAVNAEPTLDNFDVGVLTLGAGAVITNNTANGAKSNIHLATAISGADSLIKLDDSHDGVCAGVSCSWGSGPFTTNVNVTASDAALFTSDDPAYAVRFVTDHLELVGFVTVSPVPVANTTFMIYTNEVPVDATSILVEQGTSAYVVYTADNEYFFSENVSVVTNTCDTSVNPAVIATPNTPGKIISDVPCAKADETVIVPAEKPEEAEEDVWEKATNMVATVTTAEAPAIVADEVLTNAVTEAKEKLEIAGTNVVEVLALVDVAVTPTGVEADALGDVRTVKMDVTPWLTTYAEVKDSVSSSVSTSLVAEATTDFTYSGKPMLIAFSVANLADEPMLIVHTHGGRKYNYVRGDAATESTFVYEAATQSVLLKMSTFSELAVYSDIQVGDNAYARVADGVCTITGSGAMWDAGAWKSKCGGTNPLKAYQGVIRDIRIQDGVTSVGSQFFHKFYLVTNVTAAASVTSVGDYAFFRCNSLEAMDFAGSVTFGEQSYTLQAGIYMQDGMPVVYPIPAITTQGRSPVLVGKKKLTDEHWTDITTEAMKKDYRFFKIELR